MGRNDLTQQLFSAKAGFEHVQSRLVAKEGTKRLAFCHTLRRSAAAIVPPDFSEVPEPRTQPFQDALAPDDRLLNPENQDACMRNDCE